MKMGDKTDEERPRFLFICTNLLLYFRLGFLFVCFLTDI